MIVCTLVGPTRVSNTSRRGEAGGDPLRDSGILSKKRRTGTLTRGCYLVNGTTVVLHLGLWFLRFRMAR